MAALTVDPETVAAQIIRMPETDIQFEFDNTFARRLDGCYATVQGDVVPEPELVALNRSLAEQLRLDADALDGLDGAAIFSGSVCPEGAAPLAQVYAGHQFGGFAPRLGDGRALLLGEVIDRDGERWDIQLKGSGRTPFSRSGDGKAVLGPVLREYLVAEAMHALGVPTTRALAAVVTGERIMRESWQPGAVLTRVASSHIRVGTLQYFAARGEVEQIRQLADYAIQRHYPHLQSHDSPYLGLIREVGVRQARLIARWMHVGFVHGVMNTDNMTLSGETIDYGPCAFVDFYDHNAVYSSIDYMGRYAYSNQPLIGQWNLARLAETLVPLIDPDDHERAIEMALPELEKFMELYEENWLQGMTQKIGLAKIEKGDAELVQDLLETLQGQEVDFTLFFRRLADVTVADPHPVSNLFIDSGASHEWLKRWHQRLQQDSQTQDERKKLMNGINPLYIPRNYQVEHALQSASNHAEFEPFRKLHRVLLAPYVEQQGMQQYAEPPPDDFGRYMTYCGT